MDDLSRLKSSEHMLKWLSQEPFVTIRSEVARMLQQQLPDSQLAEFCVTSDPQWLTGARPASDDPNRAVLVRTGVAFEVRLIVHEPGGKPHELQGTYSWVGVHLDDPPNAKQRMWLDLGATLQTHGSQGELQPRLYFD